MAGKITTLFVQDTNVRLLVTRGKQVELWSSAPLEPGLVTGGVIRDEARVAERIRELFLLTKTGKGKIIVGLSGLGSLYRVITLPELADALLPEAVHHEAARVLPVPLDELYLSYQRIPSPAGESHIFVAVFPKIATDILIRTLRKAGVTPGVLDLAPLALCRVVDEPKAIIIGARLDHLDIIVMTGRVPQVIRSLSLPSESKTLSDNLPNISEELSRTVAFYNSSHQQEPLDSSVPVFVSGDLAKAPDSWKSIVGKLNSPVSILPSPVTYPDNFPVADFMVNIGLASKELLLEKETANTSLVNFNALPEAYLPVRINPVRIVLPIVGVAGIGFLFFLLFTLRTNNATTESLTSQLTSVENQIASSGKEIAALTGQNRAIQSQIEPVAATVEVFKAKLTSLETAQEKTNSDLHQVVSLKPQAVTVYSVSSSEGSPIVMNGKSPSEEQISEYARALRGTGIFSVLISSIQYSPEFNELGDRIDWFSFVFVIE